MDFRSWAKESFEFAAKIAYGNEGHIGSPEGWKQGLRDGGGGSRASLRIHC